MTYLEVGVCVGQEVPVAAQQSLPLDELVLEAAVVAVLGGKNSANSTANDDHIRRLGGDGLGRAQGDLSRSHCTPGKTGRWGRLPLFAR